MNKIIGAGILSTNRLLYLTTFVLQTKYWLNIFIISCPNDMVINILNQKML